jgi:anti-sigma regulatory factor (Ser/Thr protein kinase)
VATRLKPRWLEGCDPLPILDTASISIARERIRTLGASLRLDGTIVEAVAVIATELAQNQLRHASAGDFVARAIERDGVAGMEIIAADRGPGIYDPTRALSEAPAVDGSLAAGLSGVCRLADEVDFEIRYDEGTCVWARKFAKSPRRKSEAALVGMPRRGEDVSGDDGSFLRSNGRLVALLADGLGHGPEAREASERAVAAARPLVDEGLPTMFQACDRALGNTRGAAVAIATLELATGSLEHVGVGDVETRALRALGPFSFGCAPGVVGDVAQQRAHRRLNVEGLRLERDEAVVLFTDGLPSTWSHEVAPELRREHPVAIAHHVLQRFGRDYDDATVLVFR